MCWWGGFVESAATGKTLASEGARGLRVAVEQTPAKESGRSIYKDRFLGLKLVAHEVYVMASPNTLFCDNLLPSMLITTMYTKNTL
ncbi:hypothetical protein BIY29_10870 [Brenneria alni]|uniref:Uncharacterized protein n=1 Tax=Brenneria alni TaxID=71656 RepID=A0A421DN81_9GAMM|nr:hypothetical protein BIY29_10870 [Brenneria alni]